VSYKKHTSDIPKTYLNFVWVAESPKMVVMRAYQTQQKVQNLGKRTIIATVKNRAVHRIRESEHLPLTSDRAAVRHKKTFSGPAAGKQRKRHKEPKIDNNGKSRDSGLKFPLNKPKRLSKN